MNYVPVYSVYDVPLALDPGFMLAAMSMALLALVLLGVTAFADSGQFDPFVRRYLAWRLEGTRMFRMLQRRHVVPLAYILETPTAEIRRQLARCRSCPRHEQCDAAMDYFGPRHPSYAFCPNRRAIDALANA